MKRIHIASSIALGLGALLLSGSATGYTLYNPVLTWDCPPSIIVDETGIASIADATNGVAIAVSSINAVPTTVDTWNNAGAARIVAAVKGSTANIEVGDSQPMIHFGDPEGYCTGICLAKTMVTATEREVGYNSWRVIDSDTFFNVSHDWTSQGEDPNGVGCSNEAYLESTLVHEVGHALGLDHSSVAGATMFSNTALCNQGPATIESDDVAGILALYGTAPCTNSLFSPCVTHTQFLHEDDDSLDFQPCGTSFTMGGSGTIKGWIEGPLLADFDLFLQKQTYSGWQVVASGTTTNASEAISYSATAGTYRFYVTAFDGSGNYHFWYKRPTFFP
jgi:hypothetical protein